MLLSFSITFLYLDRATAWDSAATDDA